MILLSAAAILLQGLLIASNISVTRFSFLGKEEAPYSFPLLLGLVEVLKLFISIVGSKASGQCDKNRDGVDELEDDDRDETQDHESGQTVDSNPLWMYAVPGILYPLSNSVDFLVVGIVTPGELSLLWNLKIASTAILYRCVLKQRLKIVQWMALFTLLVGVIILELSMQTSANGTVDADTLSYSGQNSSAHHDSESQDYVVSTTQRTLALVLVFGGTVLASFASVVTEWIFKRSREGIWLQNAKLYSFSILVFLATVGLRRWIEWTTTVNADDSTLILNNASASPQIVSGNVTAPSAAPRHDGSLFYGWNWFCVLLLLLKSGHGVFTGFLLKYFNVILTIHADALATVMNVVSSAILWGLRINFTFVFGSVVTLSSILVYHHTGNARKQSTDEQAQDSRYTKGGGENGEGGAIGALRELELSERDTTSEEYDEDTELLSQKK